MEIKTFVKDFEVKELIGDITEVEEISVDCEITEQEFTKKDGEVFKIYVITVNNKPYRLPVSVLGQLKIQLEENPKVKTFKVIKKGKGLATEYVVVIVK